MRVSSFDKYVTCGYLFCFYNFIFIQTLGLFFLSLRRIFLINKIYACLNYFYIAINIVRQNNIASYFLGQDNISRLFLSIFSL